MTGQLLSRRRDGFSVAMKKASAFAPGHITGLFQICDSAKDPLLRGSRGAGFSIAQGVYTTVTAEPAKETQVTININGRLSREARVSENVLGKMLPRMTEPHKIEVDHVIETPFGAGFGSSGGGALSLSLALNEVLSLGLTRIEAASVAHVAEIECKTGLGTVYAALVAGFGVLVKAGGPGVGRSIRYGDVSRLRLVYLHFGPISTSRALSDPEIKRRINELGGSYVDQIASDMSPELFMRLSRQFTDHVGMVTPRLKRIFNETDKAGLPSAMAMFGEVAFSLIDREKADDVATVFEAAAPGHEAIIVSGDDEPARLLAQPST